MVLIIVLNESNGIANEPLIIPIIESPRFIMESIIPLSLIVCIIWFIMVENSSIGIESIPPMKLSIISINGAIIEVSMGKSRLGSFLEPINIPIMELIIVDISVIEALPAGEIKTSEAVRYQPPLWINVVKFIRSFKLIEVEFGIVNPTRSWIAV